MRQGILAFGPRALLPENPNVGAAIISASIPQPSKGEELVEDVEPKGHRDLDNYKRAEILNYLNKHTMKETFRLGPASNPYVACGLHLSICAAINSNQCFALLYVARPLGPHVGSAVGGEDLTPPPLIDTPP